ncbi:MAG: uroporphyrinogen-III C-methyltransferase [Actinomycetota bacterium]
MTVHLVGVGPGDGELLTVKAARLLEAADAVVYDRLIGADILDHVPPSAERYPVGKTPGRPGPTQEQINDLLVHLGTRFATVVRVKGGDPFVFGRGIEELTATTSAGIPTEVVPGISSALSGPLAAGISVTGRGVASGICVVTAQQDPDSAPIDWRAVAKSGLTIVVLMGAARAGSVRRRLLAGGLAPQTPAAVVTDATLPDQRTWYGSLDELSREPVAAPSVLVIGAAAGRRVPAEAPLGTARERPVSATAGTPACRRP